MNKLLLILLISFSCGIAFGQQNTDSVRTKLTYDSLISLADSLVEVERFEEAKKIIVQANQIKP